MALPAPQIQIAPFCAAAGKQPELSAATKQKMTVETRIAMRHHAAIVTGTYSAETCGKLEGKRGMKTQQNPKRRTTSSGTLLRSVPPPPPAGREPGWWNLQLSHRFHRLLVQTQAQPFHHVDVLGVSHPAQSALALYCPRILSLDGFIGELGNGEYSKLASQSRFPRRTPQGGKVVFGSPVCLYCPLPEFSDEAIKAEDLGTVLVQALIGPDGRAKDIHVVKGLGLGLDEKAMEAVRGWRFRPASSPSGQAAG